MREQYNLNQIHSTPKEIKFKMSTSKLENNRYYDLGLSLFGPLLYEFCNWINDNIEKNSQLFFVSREGEFLKKCYDTLFPNDKTKMIYLSRKSVVSGATSGFLNEYSLNDLVNMMSFKRNETIKELFERIGLNFNKYETSLMEFNINFDSPANIDLNEFYEKNKKSIINDLKKYNELFDKYLDVTLSKSNTLVDIGWKGSMQNILEKYLSIKKSNKKITGLYLGVMDDKNKKGYLFSDNNSICQNVLNYSGLLELIMMPDYGSVIGYKNENEVIKPIFNNTEFSRHSLEIIGNIQKGIIDFITKMKSLYNRVKFDRNEIIKTLNKFGTNPKLKDIKYFENLDFYDNGKKYHLIEPIEITKLKENFINTKWKTAFLKKIFKIRLPYNKIVIFLRKLNDKHEKGIK